MNTLHKHKKMILEVPRTDYAMRKILKLGFTITKKTDSHFEFEFKGSTVRMFPFSGWHTGKTIKDGRGIANLIKQLKK